MCYSGNCDHEETNGPNDIIGECTWKKGHPYPCTTPEIIDNSFWDENNNKIEEYEYQDWAL